MSAIEVSISTFVLHPFSELPIRRSSSFILHLSSFINSQSCLSVAPHLSTLIPHLSSLIPHQIQSPLSPVNYQLSLNPNLPIQNRDRLQAIVPRIRRPIFQIQHTPRADAAANATTHTARPHNVLTTLRIRLHIDPHLAIRAAIPAGNALTAIRRDAEAAEILLQNAQDRSLRAAKPAPNP